MSDLHGRITAALLREDQLRVCKLSDADIKFMADAVIRELGLRQEARNAVVPHVGIVKITPETFTTDVDHRQETRYVTEWTADE